MSPARPPEGVNSLLEGRPEAPWVSSIHPDRPPEAAISLSEGRRATPRGYR